MALRGSYKTGPGIGLSPDRLCDEICRPTPVKGAMGLRVERCSHLTIVEAPLATAKSICRDYLKVGERGPDCDASDVQELWVKVFERQGRIIYPEQQRIFRKLDRSAIQGTLSRGDLDRADKVLRTFKAPGTLDRRWAKAELLADLALSGGDS
jgi:hypothetical protein